MATAVSFTGGKDSVLALHLVSGFQHILLPHQHSTPPVTLLVTFAPPGSDFKAHPLPIIQALAKSLNIPHLLLEVHHPFLDSYRQHLERLHQDRRITHLVTGDILDVAAGFMQLAVQGTAVQLVRPLWHCPRQHVLTVLQDLKICSKISCIDLGKYQPQQGKSGQAGQLQRQQQQQQQPSGTAQPATSCCAADSVSCDSGACSAGFDAERDLLGHELTPDLVRGPLTVAGQLFDADLCGERGEYHTLVFDAPLMQASLQLMPSEQRVVHSGPYRHAYVVWGPV
jgi:diphthamide synthase (EF-2-diphthine--ammonia ligase)